MSRSPHRRSPAASPSGRSAIAAACSWPGWCILIAGLGACFGVPASTDIAEEGTGESREAIQLFEERFGADDDRLTEFLVISHDTSP